MEGNVSVNGWGQEREGKWASGEPSFCSSGLDEEGIGKRVGLSFLQTLSSFQSLSWYPVSSEGCGYSQELMNPGMGDLMVGHRNQLLKTPLFAHLVGDAACQLGTQLSLLAGTSPWGLSDWLLGLPWSMVDGPGVNIPKGHERSCISF